MSSWSLSRAHERLHRPPPYRLAGVALAWFLTSLLVAMPAAAPPPPGYPPYPPVLVTINPPNPRAGDNLTIDVYAYRGGVAADADATPEVYVIPGQPPAVTRVGTGHYLGSYALPPHNASREMPAYFHLAGLEVFANITGVPAIRTLTFQWFEPGLYLRMSVDRATYLIGDPVTARVEVFKEGALLDPDNITMYLDVAGGNRVNVTPSRESLGVYSGSAVLPVVSPAYSAVTLSAVAHLDGQEFRQAVDIQLAQYQVWFHGTSLTTTNIAGELWVANEMGAPSPGVALRLFVNGSAIDGVTDSRGAFPVSFDVPTTGQVFIDGTVGRGTQRENFFITTLFPSEFPFASAVPLDSPLLGDGTLRDFLRPGQPVTRAFQLIDRSIWRNRSFASMEMDYAVWTSHEVVANGRVRADAQATVQVTFQAPEHDVSVGFAPDAGPPLQPATFRVGSRAVALNVSAITLGGATRVRTSVASSLEEVWDAQPHFYSQSEVRLLNPPPGERWERLTDTLGDSLYSAPGGMDREYDLPTFLPHGGKYLVAVSVSEALEPMIQFTVLGVGEAGDIPLNTTFRKLPGSSTPLPDPLIAGIVAAGIAVVGVAAWIVLRRRRRTSPPPVP